MKRRHLMTAALAAPLLTAIPQAAWAQTAATDASPTGFDATLVSTQPQQAVEAWLNSEKAAGLQGLNKVSIAQFRVMFATQGISSASAGGGLGSTGSAHMHGRYVLGGVDDALMQSLTDAAYARLSQALVAQGLTVVPFADLPGTALERFRQDAVPAPAELNTALGKGQSKDFKLFSATGLPLYFSPSDPLRAQMGMRVALSGLGWDSLDYVESGIAGSGQMGLLKVTLVMDFIQMETSGGFFSRTASVGGEPGIQLTTASNLRAMVPQGLAERPKPSGGTVWATASYSFDHLPVVTLKQPIQPAQSGVLGVTDVTDAGVAAVQTALTVIGFLGGMGGGRKDKRWEVKVDPVQYRAAAESTMGAVMEAWAVRVAAKP